MENRKIKIYINCGCYADFVPEAKKNTPNELPIYAYAPKDYTIKHPLKVKVFKKTVEQIGTLRNISFDKLEKGFFEGEAEFFDDVDVSKYPYYVFSTYMGSDSDMGWKFFEVMCSTIEEITFLENARREKMRNIQSPLKKAANKGFNDLTDQEREALIQYFKDKVLDEYYYAYDEVSENDVAKKYEEENK